MHLIELYNSEFLQNSYVVTVFPLLYLPNWLSYIAWLVLILIKVRRDPLEFQELHTSNNYYSYERHQLVETSGGAALCRAEIVCIKVAHTAHPQTFRAGTDQLISLSLKQVQQCQTTVSSAAMAFLDSIIRVE